MGWSQTEINANVSVCVGFHLLSPFRRGAEDWVPSYQSDQSKHRTYTNNFRFPKDKSDRRYVRSSLFSRHYRILTRNSRDSAASPVLLLGNSLVKRPNTPFSLVICPWRKWRASFPGIQWFWPADCEQQTCMCQLYLWNTSFTHAFSRLRAISWTAFDFIYVTSARIRRLMEPTPSEGVVYSITGMLNTGRYTSCVGGGVGA